MEKQTNCLSAEERKTRIVARGEVSSHSHIITGNATVRNENGEIFIDIHGDASIKHLIETAWLAGQEQWTNEHADISLTDLPRQIRHGDVMLEKVSDRTYKFIQQTIFDPYEKKIRAARD